MNLPAPTFVEFFAGSGLVTQGAKHACVPVWSNYICVKKAAIHGDDHFHLGSVEGPNGAATPMTYDARFEDILPKSQLTPFHKSVQKNP